MKQFQTSAFLIVALSLLTPLASAQSFPKMGKILATCTHKQVMHKIFHAEAVKIVVSAYQVSLSDNKGTQWYDVYFNTLNSAGIMPRFKDQSPWKSITRAEMAELITQVELNMKGW